MSVVLQSVTREIIEKRFPTQVVLEPEDVAELWKGSRSRKAVNAIRKRLTRGTLVPGLKKSGGRWEIPVEALLKAVGGLSSGADKEEDATPVHPQAAPPSATRRRAIGPRMSDIVGFWESVFEALDLKAAEVQRAEISAGLVWGWQQVSVAERKAMADRVIGDAADATYTDDDAAILCGRDIRTMRRWRKAGTGPEHGAEKVGNYTEIVYTREALLKWLKRKRKDQHILGVMLWKADEAGRVSPNGERDAGTLLDLLQAEHTSRESLSLAMILYRQQVADELDEAAWRLAAMPETTQQKKQRVF